MAKRAAFCPKCGAALAPPAQFCAGCGLNVVEAEVQRRTLHQVTEQRRHIDEKRMIFIALIAIMLLAYFFVK